MGLITRYLLISFLTAFAALATATENSNPQVAIETDLGVIVLELYPDKSPITVANFLNYVEDYHYDGTIFHRVIEGFMIQAGGYGYDLTPREPGDTIINESANGLKNKRGTIAMAKRADPDSARAQFFINLADNRHLDPKKKKVGFTVFGKVVQGMNVVDHIARTRTRRVSRRFANLPANPIVILKIRIIQPD